VTAQLALFTKNLGCRDVLISQRGDFASVVVWKLNGSLTSSPDILFGLPALSTDIGLYIEFVLAGLNGFPGDVVAEAIEPNLPMGKFSTIGDNALGSRETFSERS
jgi:hypothetical protein